MLRRAVDGVQPQGCTAGVADVVPRAGGHDHRELVLDMIGNPINVDNAGPLLDAEELVAVLVNLFADLIAGLQRHGDELQMVARVEHPAEVLVLDRPLLDIVAIAFHPSLSFTSSKPPAALQPLASAERTNAAPAASAPAPRVRCCTRSARRFPQACRRGSL